MLLVEFPYPSGDLHVGHWYAFAIPDILARVKRMMGTNVLYPIGFDAFGLPAENAAIKRNLNPRTWTQGNIASMKKQIASMGTSFDWSREVQTIDPAYYRWTQWLFIQLFNAGLVYQKETPANWCPSCKTVLANEQVLGGACERCGTEVEKKNMLQWNIAITKYAERLLNDLDALDWPEPIKQAQREWIGRKEGINITYNIENSNDTVTCFTTRPDTNFGATFVVIGPEHPLVDTITTDEYKTEMEKYVAAAKAKKDIERTAEGTQKTGVFTGAYCINNLNNERMPIWVSDYVLGNVGTGAVVGVPGHDLRDFHFAKTFDIAIKRVVVTTNGDTSDITNESQVQENEGTMVNSEFLNGLDIHEATTKIMDYLEEKGWGTRVVNYRIRDWGVSRQRYWGVPIPIVHCAKCGAVPVRDADLPVRLPEVDDYLPAGDGRSPLAKVDSFVHTTCPTCGESAQRETDTLDTFIDSSWYYLRYTDPKNEKEFATKDKQKNWLPVSMYSGGAEHTTMHLLYSRFWHKALFDLGLVNESEPYARRMNRGIILGPDGNKMSKSKGNVINPDEVVERLGADTVRLYLAFIGPYNEPGHYPWNPDGVVGVRRFLERVWRLQDKVTADGQVTETTERELHKAIKKVTDDALQLKFNTAISAMMTFVNVAEKEGITAPQYTTLLQLLAPFAPHITEELWALLGNSTSIHTQKWPQHDQSKLVQDTLTLGISVNGKRRGEVSVSAHATETEVIQAAQAAVAKWLEGGYKKAIVVQGRVVNFVV
jgi:leucyl-tRNA synthetase